MSAYKDLIDAAGGAEHIEGIVFGAWGWGSLPLWKDEETGETEYEWGEPTPAIPEDKRARLLTWAEAEPYLHNWSCFGGYGSPDCYAITMWTDTEVMFIVQYDGSTSLQKIPRNPTSYVPHMPGG